MLTRELHPAHLLGSQTPLSVAIPLFSMKSTSERKYLPDQYIQAVLNTAIAAGLCQIPG
jgi:hypothetical protein